MQLMQLMQMMQMMQMMWLMLSSVSANAANDANDASNANVTVLSVGDWGSAALGGYHLNNAQNTAAAMQLYLKQYNPSLVLNTGDNFYYCGIQNGSDAQIKALATIGMLMVPLYLEFGLSVSVFGINVFRSVYVALAVSLLALITVRLHHMRQPT